MTQLHRFWMSTVLSIGSVIGSLAVGMTLALTAAAPTLIAACAGLVATGIAAFCFVTLASTALQLHSAQEYRGRIMAPWVFVYIGTTPIGSIISGWVCGTAGPRAALLLGAASCLAAAAIAAAVRTPPFPDDAM